MIGGLVVHELCQAGVGIDMPSRVGARVWKQWECHQGVDIRWRMADWGYGSSKDGACSFGPGLKAPEETVSKK